MVSILGYRCQTAKGKLQPPNRRLSKAIRQIRAKMTRAATWNGAGKGIKVITHQQSHRISPRIRSEIRRLMRAGIDPPMQEKRPKSGNRT
jgi:hypothetical protein